MSFAQQRDEAKGEVADYALISPMKNRACFERSLEFAEGIFDVPEFFVLRKQLSGLFIADIRDNGKEAIFLFGGGDLFLVERRRLSLG